jgi:hypothetical protein
VNKLLGLVAADGPHRGTVPFGLQDRRLPLARQILEGVSVEQCLVELRTLEVAHLGQRRVAHDLLTAACRRSPLAEPRSGGILGPGDGCGASSAAVSPSLSPGAFGCTVAARQLLASGEPRSLYIWRVLRKSGPGSVGTSSSGRSRSRTS